MLRAAGGRARSRRFAAPTGPTPSGAWGAAGCSTARPAVALRARLLAAYFCLAALRAEAFDAPACDAFTACERAARWDDGRS